MGKYMRKAKTAGEVAVMDVSQSSLGVRTRAKTLALQKSSITPPTTTANSGSYLQLRSRRLEKPPILINDSSKRTKQGQAKERDSSVPQNQNQNPNSNNSRTRARISRADSGSRRSQKKERNNDNTITITTSNNNNKVEVEEESNKDLGIEASFGENVLDVEGRERSTRESTPCSLIRDPETIKTPGSTTRPTSSMESRGLQISSRRHIPTTHEMNQFFAGAEEEQQRQFVEKYNYDPVNDKPLPGRFEWEKVDP